MKCVTLEICIGTTCYVLGGADLLDAAETWAESHPGRLRVRGLVCTGDCRGSDEVQPPFVRINGTLSGGWKKEALLQKIQELTEEVT